MDDSATRLSSQFERAGLAVLLAFVLAVSGSIWLFLPDRTSSSFSSSSVSSSTGSGSVTFWVVEHDSIVDSLRRLERIPHPELTLLLLVGVALACAIPLLTHKPTVSLVGRFTCRLGQLLGAFFVVAGVVTSVDVLYQEHGFDTLARPLNHLNAAALAAVSVVLAGVGSSPTETTRPMKRSRSRITRVKRPVPRPLGVARESH
jgi:hypothetical protein